jgi:hypothetical protein
MRRDRTLQGAGIGAAAGAATAVIAGKRQADQILIGAAIGGAVGAGVGAYMDAQEERLARVPGTTVERIEDDTLLVRFDSDILFETCSATLGPAAMGTVEEGQSGTRGAQYEGRFLRSSSSPPSATAPTPSHKGISICSCSVTWISIGPILTLPFSRV